ncbi:response regulator transcription factor [Leptospira stimsonii]|uniref:DNA-binding response regulator n=1 Tax=Leptospira stimsonii TaxID=2202203 RepID=A0A8B3CTQ5_9LEPT|nr:response regulator transcription factor [Leptospira stimsonii]RHX86404.1 DNA-binding response regulator [Leptospira stimsonii]
MTPNKIKIGIVENDENYKIQILKVLESVPGVEEILHWESAESFWQDTKGRTLDIIFLDILLPGMSGVDLAGKLSERDPSINKIMLSNMNSDELIYNSLRYGAIGYILKSELKDIIEVIDTVLRGGAIITPTIAFRVLNSFKLKKVANGVKLTKKEKEILDHMVTGKTINRVAEFLGVSKYTIQHHVKNIYKKLNVHNRAELVKKATDIGLLPMGGSNLGEKKD